MDDIRLTDRSTWYFGAIAILVVFLSWNFLVFPLRKILGGWWMIAGALIVWGILWGLFFAWEYLKQFTQPSENEKPTAEVRKPNRKTRKALKHLQKRYDGKTISKEEVKAINRKLLDNGGSRFLTAINHAINQGWAKETNSGWSISTSSNEPPKEPEPEPRPSRRDLLLRYLLAHPYTVEGAALQMVLKDLSHETEFSKEHPVCSRANFPAKHLQSI
jgi:uncharacterized membrane protein